MKKTLTNRMVSLLIVLSMLLSFMPTAFAANTEPAVFSLESSTTSVKPGDKFTVKLNITPNSNLGSLTYHLYYNQKALELVDFNKDQAVEFGSIMEEWMIMSRDDPENGILRISGAKLNTGLSEGGTIATITFRALDNAVLDTGDFVQEVIDAGTSHNEPVLTEPAEGEKDSSYVDDVVIDPEVRDMVLKKLPTKTEYVQGQSFNVDGATMSLTYTNGMTQEIPVSQEMCSVEDMSTPGDKTVTVTYKGKKETFKIKVIKREITDVKFTPPTAEQKYKQKLENQTLDLTGAKWDVTYNDGSTEVIDVTDEMCSGYDFNQAGTQTVIVKYNRFEESFKIQVAERTMTGISLKKAPTKTVYVAGKDSVLDVKDGVLQVDYLWGPSEEVALTEDMCSGYDLSTTGNQKVTVTYQGMEVRNAFEIVVTKEVKDFTVTAPTKLNYVEGQKLDLTGGQVILNYTDGSQETLNLTQEMLSGLGLEADGSLKVGSYKVDVTVNGQTQQHAFTVEVVQKVVVDAKFTPPTAVQNYKQKLENQTLELTGAKWDVTYNDGSTEVIDVTDEMCSGYDFNQAGTQTVIVKYNQYHQANFEIQVAERTISGISLKKAPTKTVYVAGKDSVLDVKDGVLQVDYRWGPSEEVALTEDMCSGYDLSTTGNQKVTVTYQGMEVKNAFEIVVTKEVKDFTVTAPTKLNYVEGQKLDLTGGQVILNYTDDSQETLNLIQDMLSGLGLDVDGNLKVGHYKVDVTVNGQTVKNAFEVIVVEKVITNASFTKPTAEQTYKEGLKDQVLDLTGAKWMVTYNDGEQKDVPVTQEMCSGYDFNVVGTQTVTVALDGWSQTETFEINVEAKVPVNVALSSNPSKLEYTAGVDTALDLSGAQLKVTYDNETEDILPLTESMCSAVDLMQLGKQLVTVSYENLSTTFEINVKKAVMNLEWIKAPELSVYTQGQALEVPEGSFKVVYTDGSESSAIILTNSMCSNFDMNKAGQQSVKVTYTQPAEATIFEGKGTLSFTIGITGIEVTNLPLKLAYQLGEGFDGNGLTVNFVDGLTGNKTPITWASGLLAVEGYNANLNANQMLNVLYTAEDGTVYKIENAFEVKVGNLENVPGTGDNQGNQNGQGNTTQNGVSSNPLTGTMASSISMIVAILVLCVVTVSAYKLKRR